MTLNQLITRLESLALSHKQINHFFVGDITEWLANGDLKYPCVFVELNPTVISRTDHRTKYNLSIWFLDLVNVDLKTRQNEMDVMSDLTAIAEDFTALLNQVDLADDLTMNMDYNLEYFREKFEDMTLAAKLDIEVGVDYRSDRCQVPSTDVVFDKTYTDMLINNYIYTGTGSEGASITISSLGNKDILMVFKGDKLLTRSYAVIPDGPGVNEYRYSDQGQFDFGNDIEELQVIQILNRNNA